ncbi:MAG: nuclear transport factor 2 family protein [Pirellulaceae bacterium]
MTQNIASQFAKRLQKVEQTGDVQPLVEMFADNAELTNLGLQEPMQGEAGAERFWQMYLDQFDKIESQFSNVREDDSQALLEWESQGTLPGGAPIAYRGVSIFDVQDEKIVNFRTYYDSAHSLKPRHAFQSRSRHASFNTDSSANPPK